MQQEFEKILEVFDSEPSQQCVLRAEFLEDLHIDPESLAKASKRKFFPAVEFHSLPERNMTLRDKLYVFGPREAV